MADWTPVVEPSVSGAYAPDLANHLNFDLTLTGDAWLDVSSNTLADGTLCMFTFRDTTGQFSIGWNVDESGPQWFLADETSGFPKHCNNGIPVSVVLLKTPLYFVMVRTIRSCTLNLS